MRFVGISFVFLFQMTLMAQSTPIFLGDSTVILVHRPLQPQSNILYLNVHEDESTSIEAVEIFSEQTIPLNFAFLNHQQSRRVTFNVKQKSFSVDPNRIYTAKGRRLTIEPYQRYLFRSRQYAKKLAKEVLKLVHQYQVIVTMHNNTDVNYSIKSYLPGGDEAQNTKAVYVTNQWDVDDFVYTTEQAYFDYLKNKDVNVILQDNQAYVNDGSLSVYCGKKGIPYINIEAQKGHLNEQIALLKIVHTMLAEA